MKLPDKLYNILKWICLIALPALSTFLGVLLPCLNVPADTSTTVITVIAALEAFVGTLIGISNAQYTAEKNND